MLWCKETFEQSFSAEHCRLFPQQRDLFSFVDAEHGAHGCREKLVWLCFSIEFPSAVDVSRLLSRHATSQAAQQLFFVPPAPNNANSEPRRKRLREDYSLLYGETVLSQQTRWFLAATVAGVTSLTQRIESKQLHLYEIIRDGSPCHLYFDVERNENANAMQEEIEIDDVSSFSSSSSTSSSLRCTCNTEPIVVARRTTAKGAALWFRAPLSTYQRQVQLASEVPCDTCPLNCPVEPANHMTCDVLLENLEMFMREEFPSLCASNRTDEPMPSTFEEIIVMESLPLHGAVKKFSQHYVLKLREGVMFNTNQSTRHFVRRFVAFLQKKATLNRTVHAALFYHGSPLPYSVFSSLSNNYSSNCLPFFPRRCVIDEAVYSRNRTMRCLGSCKLNKDSVLRLSRWCRGGRQVTAPPDPLTSAFFFSSLIASPLVHVPVKQLIEIAGVDNAPPGTAARPNPSSSTPLGNSMHSEVEIDGAILAVAEELQRQYQEISGRMCVVHRPRRVGERYLTFQLSDTRFCCNIGREHRSNGVYLVVDVVTHAWVQKCFDPDCARYRSPSRPISSALFVSLISSTAGSGSTVRQLGGGG